jgi:hypothetical protein
MLCPERSFKKIKANTYLFIPGFAFVRKAYYVTYKEKKAIQELLSKVNCFLFSLSGGGSIAAKWRTTLGMIIFCTVPLCFYVYYKIKLRKILGNRKKQPCQRINVREHFAAFSKEQSIKDCITVYVGTIIFTAFAIIEGKNAYETSNIRLLIGTTLVMLFVIASTTMASIVVYFKYQGHKKNKIKMRLHED